MPIPFAIPVIVAGAGLIGFGTGVVVADGTKALLRTVAIGGALFLAFQFRDEIAKAFR